MRRSRVFIVATLSWRNLWRNGRRTGIMLAAIVVGVWSMVFMSALMRGMIDQSIENSLDTLPGEVQIHHPDFRRDPSVVNAIAEPSGDLLQALETPPVAAWAARVRVPAVVSSERDSRGVTLLGVDPGAERALGSVPDTISQGRFLESAKDDGVVIGAALARHLETEPGRRIVIMSQDPDNDVAEWGTRIVGLYEARLQADEERFIYVGRDVAQRRLELGRQVTEIAATAHDYRNVDRWYPVVAQAAPENLEVLPWTELDPFLGSMLAVQDGFTLIFMVVIFLALSFGLVNTLVMAIFERTREIGLMQALGMRPGSILIQVMTESTLLLLIGLCIGNLLAWLTLKPLESGIDISPVAEGMEMMSMGSTLYPALKGADMVLSTLVVLLLGLAASLIPAWRASHLDPVDALHK